MDAYIEHRSVASFFTGPVSISLLDAEVRATPGISTVFHGIVLAGSDDCGFAFESEPSVGEKALLDAICLEHPTLDSYKAAKLEALGVQVTGYLYSRYDTQRRESLLMHFPLALHEGKANRAGLIQQAMDWTAALHALYVSKGGEVLAATTHAEVDAVVIDLEAFEVANPDPHVTIPAVILTPD